MINLTEFGGDIQEEVLAILSNEFKIDLTETDSVPHSDDTVITFPNLDQKTQGARSIETTVLYVDMRRSTQLNIIHTPQTVARLYSAFVRAVTRSAGIFNGEVRGIIGDRVMIMFDTERCFQNAVDTAVLINSVCHHVINKHFTQDQVDFGIGIDFGKMLATKTGLRRHGSAQQSYRSLVWLGQPANVASKLTDAANKPEDVVPLTTLKVAYLSTDNTLKIVDEYPHNFVKDFKYNPVTGLMHHANPRFHSFQPAEQQYTKSPATPPILMIRAVLEGYRHERPNAQELQNGWYNQIAVAVPGYSDAVFGGNVFFLAFTGRS